MNLNTYFQENNNNYIEGMNEYLNKLKQQQQENPKVARDEAKEALIRTGVATTKGQIKKKIVSWR